MWLQNIIRINQDFYEKYSILVQVPTLGEFKLQIGMFLKLRFPIAKHMTQEQ